MNLFRLVNSSTRWSLTNDDQDIQSLRFSNDAQSIAIGRFDGTIIIRRTRDSKVLNEYSQFDSPITSIKYHPKRNSLLFCSAANGTIVCIDDRNSDPTYSINDGKNKINTLDMSKNGTNFAVAGSDCAVRVYDTETHKVVTEMSTILYDIGRVTGHTNRVFCCHYINDDEIASSGWDNTVIFWDKRTGLKTHSFHGPEICGESMANTQQYFITGSWRNEKQLQFFDMRADKLIRTITITDEKKEKVLQIYSVCLSPDNTHVVVGGSTLNKAVFYRIKDFENTGCTDEMKSGVTALDLRLNKFGMGTGDSTVLVDTFSTK